MSIPVLVSGHFKRQFQVLQQQDPIDAQEIWDTLCHLLIHYPSSGHLVLNDAMQENELISTLRQLATVLGRVDLRVLRSRGWLLLYLFNGREVCLLGLMAASTYAAQSLDELFGEIVDSQNRYVKIT